MKLEPSDPVDALVLAGRRAGEADAVAAAAGVSCKAFAPVAGQAMVERVAGVLLAHPRVERVEVALAASGDWQAQAPALHDWLDQGRVTAAAPAGSPAATVAARLGAARRALLVTTADHALLTPAMVDRFLDGCGAHPGADALAALLPLPILEARYPGMRRTGLKLRDGRYAGCNLFLLRPGPGARAAVAFWVKLEGLRKQPWRMARAVGPGAALGYGLGLMSLARALAAIGRRAGGRLAPVILDIPEAAIDVDTPEDLAFAERLLRRAGSGEPDMSA